MTFSEKKWKSLITANILITILYIIISYFVFSIFKNLELLPMPICAGAALTLIAAFYIGVYAAPAIIVGTTLANYFIFNTPIDFALCIAVTSTLVSLFTGILIRRQLSTNYYDRSFCNIVHSFNLAVILAPLLSGLGGASAKYFLGIIPLQDFTQTFAKWTVAHSLGILFFAIPFLLHFINKSSKLQYVDGTQETNVYIDKCIIAATTILSVYFWIIDSLFEFLWFPGNKTDILPYFFPVSDIHGLVVRFLVIFTFIICAFTVYKIVSFLLRQQRDALMLAQDLSTTLNSIGDGVISTDDKGIITRINPIAQQLTGWNRTEATGTNITEVFILKHQFTGKTLPNPVTRVIQNLKRHTLNQSAVLISRSGQEFSITDSAAPIISPAGKLTGAIMVFRDITAEYEVQKRLKHSQRMDAIGQLAGGVAHDFNNMLGGIIGFSELLAKKVNNDSEAATYVQMILDTSDKAASLTRKLLTFAKKTNIPATNVDIHKIITSSTELLQRTIDRRINIATSFLAEKFIVMGDSSQLQNIFINLGINAAHAMKGDGTITISTRNIILDSDSMTSWTTPLNPGDYIEIKVTDTGCGITQEDLPRIFEPFFTTRERDQGTGLGLSAVYGSIKQHKGDISVSSTPGTGTTFTLLLPASAEDSSARNQEPINETTNTGSGHILIVDDEEIMRITARHILENSGYKVTSATNGREALALFHDKSKHYDLIILDMIMPEMNGKDCFKELRRHSVEIPVILASGFSQDSDIREMEKEEVVSFISKPYKGKELLNAIHELLTVQP